MMKWHFLLITFLLALGILYFGPAHAKRSYLNSVNSTCATSYGCDLCHIDPRGGDPLTTDGQAFRDSG